MRDQPSQTGTHRTVELVVHGRVQGVGFRYYTRACAQRSGVVGWVRNREDGTVEIRAEATEERLRQFIQAVRRGPSHSDVTRVDLTWDPPADRQPSAPRPRSFHIRD
jgi:acylphosphatase